MLDSFAVLALLYGEEGQDKVQAMLGRAADGDLALFMAAPNWAELRYVIERRSGPERWTEVRDKLLGLPMEVIPADRALAEVAGGVKASRRLSLADAFAAALAMEKNARLVTGDPEFECVEKEIRVLWL